MNHQARQLLQLVNAASLTPASGTTCRSIVVSSGSGGVGRSLFALQTALALGEADQQVALLDANAGLSHTALLAGHAEWRSLDQLGPGTSPDDVALQLNPQVSLITGVAKWLSDGLTDRAASRLDEWLEGCQWCVIDAGPRTQPGVQQLLLSADIPALVTTAEPVPLAETYAAMRSLAAAGRSDVSLILNRVASDEVGRSVGEHLSQTVAQFLNRRTAIAATLVDEATVAKAARSRNAGRFLGETNFGRSIAEWTTRLSRAA